MEYLHRCRTPLGTVLLTGDGEALTGLRFDASDRPPGTASARAEQSALPVFQQAERWLEIYFTGRDPGFIPPLGLRGTPFRLAVWELLLTIPYGQTVTYGQIARTLAERGSFPRASARAVGTAVGHNPLWLMVPCHRVVGANGGLTGYAGGLELKRRLLALEGADLKSLKTTAKGTAL